MQDERGLYYHANAGDPGSRVYVRRGPDGEVEFRLWEAAHPEIWERHPWLNMAVIREAAALYENRGAAATDPLRIYDLAVARALLAEAGPEAGAAAGNGAPPAAPAPGAPRA
ncbi:hypothetical protein [uncultured Desulfovibrio sp.]|uniref:hypothetical protein n=1 Tax=uncultured Desulfovibrio sp. TaxID=167968 RepID=UPI002803D691|nr:hypothetical protein [uncultured Desulfovibrio sp.]